MSKSNKFWIFSSLLFACLLGGFFIYKSSLGVGNLLDWTLLYSWYKYLSFAVAAFLVVCLYIFLVTNKQVYGYLDEVVTEIKKVVWPQKKEIKGSTIAVIIITVICSVILALFDSAWSYVFKMVYYLGNKIFGLS